MSYLAPHVREEDRIGGGHPEGLFEAWANWYHRFAIATDATDRGDHAAGRIPVTGRPRRRGRHTVGGTLRCIGECGRKLDRFRQLIKVKRTGLSAAIAPDLAIGSGLSSTACTLMSCLPAAAPYFFGA